MPAGNEAAGIVVAAGEGAEGLMGKRVACVPGTAYGTYAYAEAVMCMPVGGDVSAEQAASSFVNPMTALGFAETMKLEGFTGIVHAAAALGVAPEHTTVVEDTPTGVAAARAAGMRVIGFAAMTPAGRLQAAGAGADAIAHDMATVASLLAAEAPA